MEDEDVACNIIKCNRDYMRKNTIAKGITLPLYKQKKGTLSICLNMQYNINTGTLSLSHNLRWKHYTISPTTNKKLRCTNQHALDKLEQVRLLSKLYTKKIERFQFYETIGLNISHRETISYNPNNGNISIRCFFYGVRGHKLPTIDI